MNKIKTFIEEKNIAMLLLLLFLFSIIIRTTFGICFGQMNVFYDELLHWNLSKSIYYGMGNNFRNDILNYKEILYSAVISFSHYFGNTEMQYFVAVGINSVLMSSVIFPVYGMSVRFLDSKEKAAIVASLSIFIPEMVYTAKIIQENLYYPLVIWFFYLFIVVIMKEQYKIRNIILLGIYVFVISICKQMALNVFAGVVLYYILQFFIFDKENRKRCVVSMVWFSAIFMGLKFLYGVIFNVLNGLSNISSSEVTIGVILENLIDPYLLSQLIYPAITYILLSILFFGFFTVMLPLSIVKKLSVKERNLFILVGTIFISTIAVICLRIIPSENLNDVSIRFHFRYLFFLLIPLLILFMSIYEKLEQNKLTLKVGVISAGYLLLLEYINIMPAEGSKIDCVGFNYIKYLFDSEMMVKTFHILVVLCVSFGCFLLYKKKIKTLYFMVIISFVISGFVSNCYTYSEYYKNKVDSVSKKEDAFTINSYFHDNIKSEDKDDFNRLLIISESKVSDAKLEVYLQYPNYYFCKMKDFNDFMDKNEGETFASLNLYSFNIDFSDEALNYPEYIISDEPLYLDEYEEVHLELNKYHFYVRNNEQQESD